MYLIYLHYTFVRCDIEFPYRYNKMKLLNKITILIARLYLWQIYRVALHMHIHSCVGRSNLSIRLHRTVGSIFAPISMSRLVKRGMEIWINSRYRRSNRSIAANRAPSSGGNETLLLQSSREDSHTHTHTHTHTYKKDGPIENIKTFLI